MKTISSELETHLQGPLTTLATLWRIVRKDAQTFGFTDHDVSIQFDDGSGLLTYEAQSGFTRTAITKSMGLNVDNLDLEGFLTSNAISEEDLRAGRWDNASVYITFVNYNKLSQGGLKQLRGFLGEVTIRDESYSVELRSLAQPWQQQITKVYTPNCTADLGDSRCKVDLSSFTESGSVDTVVDARTITVTGVTEADDFYTGGLLKFTSGPNDGTVLEINDWTLGTATVVTFLGMPFEPDPGDTFDIIAGCDKTPNDCINKFDNMVNFRGFPDVPNQRKVQRVNSPTD